MSKMRKEAKHFARHLVSNLEKECCDWAAGGGALRCGELAIYLHPRRFRVFDGVYVKLGEVDVWIPFFQRLRLRRQARLMMAVKANAAIKCGD